MRHTHLDPGAGVDMVLCCVPDAAVPELVASWPVHPATLVVHCSGSLGLDVLHPHPRRASVHPLVSLPDGPKGALRLRGAWFGVAGDPAALKVVEALEGTAVEVPDELRGSYHAAAAIASNHLVALMGQVERVAAQVGVPLEAYLALAGGSLANVAEQHHRGRVAASRARGAEGARAVAELGPPAALTGPVARGDWSTVRRHLEVIDRSEHPAYLAMAAQAARLVGTELPAELADDGS